MLSSIPAEYITYCHFWSLKRDLSLPVAILNTQKVLIDYLILAYLPYLLILFSPSCRRVTAVGSCLLWATWSIIWSQTTLCFAPVVCVEIVLSCWSSCILSLFYQHFDLREEEFVSIHDSVMEPTIKYLDVSLVWHDIGNVFGDICCKWLGQTNP